MEWVISQRVAKIIGRWFVSAEIYKLRKRQLMLDQHIDNFNIACIGRSAACSQEA